MSIHIHIDRLVVDRSLAGDREAYAEAIRAALTRELARPRPPASRVAESLDAGTSSAAPASIGGRIAAAVGRTLK